MQAISAAFCNRCLYLVIIYGYIAGYRLGEDHAVLHHHAALPAPPFLVERVDIRSTYINLSTQHGIIAQHEFDERGLSTARCSDNSCYLAFGDIEAYIIYDSFQCVRVVFEVYVFQVYTPAFFFY